MTNRPGASKGSDVKEVTVLILGDIVGRPGREAVVRLLGGLVEKEAVDFVIANGENAAGGLGITPRITQDLLAQGVDVITTGNHVYKRQEIRPMLAEEKRLLRPANFPATDPGCGHVVIEKHGHAFAVVNLMGEIFFDHELQNPFTLADELISALRKKTPMIFVDFHAEATSEKVAMGHHLDGRVTAVVGTHTHVQTADAQVLPGGTAYMTDVGMTGPIHSVIGVTIERSLSRFVTKQHQRFTTAPGPARLDACLITADPKTGHAHTVRGLQLVAS